MTDSSLVAVNLDDVYRLKGYWLGFAQVLPALHDAAGKAIPTAWQGTRAAAFGTWWANATGDFETITFALGQIVQALDLYYQAGRQLNDKLASVDQAIRKYCKNVIDNGGNKMSGAFSIAGQPSPDDPTPFTINVAGFELVQPSWLGDPPPTWVHDVQATLSSVRSGWLSANQEAAQLVTSSLGPGGDPAQFAGVRQFTPLARKAAQAGYDPLNGSGDPTWAELAPGVFRPRVGSGFTTDPYGTDLMPQDYDPGTLHKVNEKLGEMEPLIDGGAAIGAILLTAVGAPELGFGLISSAEVLVHGTKVELDLFDNDWSDVPWDAADLALDGADIGSLAERMSDTALMNLGGVNPETLNDTLTSLGVNLDATDEAELESTLKAAQTDLTKASTGDKAAQVAYATAMARVQEMVPQANGALTDYFTSRLKDAARETSDGKQQISVQDLSGIMGEFQSEQQVLGAADQVVIAPSG